jgi:arginine N-succinyltransferase
MTEALRLVRPVRETDIGPLVDLARALGSGMTTLPPDPATISRKVDASIRTFRGEALEDSQYILVLEDGESGQVLGLSGVYPRIGDEHGFFSYKLTRLIQRSIDLGRRYEMELLTLSNDYTGATEVGSLAILPTLRRSGAGRLLSRARFMLIGAFPNLFAPRVMAEMRGWQEDDGHSPFWEAIGARFFGMAFDEADRLSAIQGAGFIADLMPKQPIYTAILPDDAREAIGRAHVVSARAMAMLLDEDFRYTGHVDVFDGGPQVEAQRETIRTIAQSCALTVESDGAPEETDQRWLLSNTGLTDFRVLSVPGRRIDNRLLVTDAAIEALCLRPGDLVRAAPGTCARG